jgi:hypothetical protein
MILEYVRLQLGVIVGKMKTVMVTAVMVKVYDRQCTYNVALRRVRSSAVAMEKQ